MIKPITPKHRRAAGAQGTNFRVFRAFRGSCCSRVSVLPLVIPALFLIPFCDHSRPGSVPRDPPRHQKPRDRQPAQRVPPHPRRGRQPLDQRPALRVPVPVHDQPRFQHGLLGSARRRWQRRLGPGGLQPHHGRQQRESSHHIQSRISGGRRPIPLHRAFHQLRGPSGPVGWPLRAGVFQGERRQRSPAHL